jgi:hypothetical protein
LTSFAQSQFYQQKLKENHIIFQVWKLLKTPKIKICQKAINFFEHIVNLGAHLQG